MWVHVFLAGSHSYFAPARHPEEKSPMKTARLAGSVSARSQPNEWATARSQNSLVANYDLPRIRSGSVVFFKIVKNGCLLLQKHSSPPKKQVKILDEKVPEARQRLQLAVASSCHLLTSPPPSFLSLREPASCLTGRLTSLSPASTTTGRRHRK